MTESNKEQVNFLLDRDVKAEIMRLCKERGTTLTFLLQKHIKEVLKNSRKDGDYLP
jgi:hypothetical protein